MIIDQMYLLFIAVLFSFIVPTLTPRHWLKIHGLSVCCCNGLPWRLCLFVRELGSYLVFLSVCL
jgi:hypothetical protein